VEERGWKRGRLGGPEEGVEGEGAEEGEEEEEDDFCPMFQTGSSTSSEDLELMLDSSALAADSSLLAPDSSAQTPDNAAPFNQSQRAGVSPTDAWEQGWRGHWSSAHWRVPFQRQEQAQAQPCRRPQFPESGPNSRRSAGFVLPDRARGTP